MINEFMCRPEQLNAAINWDAIKGTDIEVLFRQLLASAGFIHGVESNTAIEEKKAAKAALWMGYLPLMPPDRIPFVRLTVVMEVDKNESA